MDLLRTMSDKAILSVIWIGLHLVMAIGGLCFAFATRTYLESFAAQRELIKVYGPTLGKLFSMRNPDGSYASKAPAVVLRITGILVAVLAISLLVFVDFA